MKALIFDDDPNVRTALLALLNRMGWSAKAYEHPGAYLDCPALRQGCCVGASCCEAIITDFDMPSMNGIELIRRLKAHGCACRHIAMLSGTWDAATRETARQLGCAVFDKPVQLDALSSWLEDVQQASRPAAPGGGAT